MAKEKRELKKTVELKTKDKYSFVANGKDTGYLAMERYKNKTIKWYPFWYNARDNKVEKKYSTIKFIGTDCGKIPSTGFSGKLATGYGFTKFQGVEGFFRFLESKLGNLINGVMFTEKDTTLNNGIFYISFRDFGRIRFQTKSLSESQKKDQGFLYQSIASDLFPGKIEKPTKYLYTPGSLKRFMEKYSDSSLKLNIEDVESVVGKLDVEKQAIITTRKIIEKIYIEDVLKEYKELMSQKTDTDKLEERWHQLFKKHTWLFSSVFAYPAVYFADKLNLGGHDITGGRDKIVDFVFKNKVTRNISFIEIKTHRTQLVQKSPYRKPNIYAMSSCLTGSLVQVMDQKTTFLKSYHSLKGSSDIDSINSNCLVVIGSSSELKDKGRIDSFELFRLSNKDVTIITFDELQEKMEQLLKIFTSEK